MYILANIPCNAWEVASEAVAWAVGTEFFLTKLRFLNRKFGSTSADMPKSGFRPNIRADIRRSYSGVAVFFFFFFSN